MECRDFRDLTDVFLRTAVVREDEEKMQYANRRSIV
jgi:hypothetical protein